MKPDFLFSVLFPCLFGVMALSFFAIGLRGIIARKPFVISSQWLLGIVLIAFAAVIVQPFLFPLPPVRGRAGIEAFLPWLAAAMFIVLAVFMWLALRGYLAFGVTESSFRDALLASLRKLGLPHEETLAAVRLPSIGADLQVAVQSWIGTGQLKMRQRHSGDVLANIAKGMNEYYQSSKVSTNLTSCIFYVVTAAFLLVFAAALPFTLGDDSARPDAAQVDAERTQRQAAVADIAPTKLPTAVLIDKIGQDPDGYPLTYVDRAALRSLLWHKRYSNLTRHFEHFQSEFEADPRKEYWPSDAADTFSSAEPDLRPALDAWIGATPSSFAPYLARGSYLVSVAYARRGTKFAAETADADFAAMKQAIDAAVADLDRALELRPKLVAAMRLKIRAGRTGRRDFTEKPTRVIVDEAIAVCRSCFQVRVTYMYALTPRWGGSHEAMAEFARHQIDRSNPKMRFLPGYVDYDKAQLLVLAKKPREALAAIERACALGEHWEFLYQRGEIKGRLDDFEGAVKDLDRALALRAGHPEMLIHRANVQLRARRWEAAGRDLVAGIRIDPTDALARDMLDGTVRGLVYEGWQHHTAGRRDDALRIYDLAAELAPNDQEVQSRRAFIVSGKTGSGGDNIAALEESARKSPDDFRAMQQLDYALARQRQFPRIVEIWNAYLVRNPDNAAAYLERSGTYFHMRKMEESHADAQKACELGSSEGCTRAKQVRAIK